MIKAIQKIGQSKWWLLIVLALIVAVNWAASIWHTRLDLTDEKRFTLSAASKKVIRKVDEPIQIDIFLKGNFPSGFKQLAGATGDLLKEFKEVAGSKLSYSFIAPEDTIENMGTTYADSLLSMGLIPINLTSQVKSGQQQNFVYPFAVITYKNRIVPVTLYQGKSPFISNTELNSAEAMLEYNLANAIQSIFEEERSVVAYATGNGEPQQIDVYDLVENVLKVKYDLYTVDPNLQPFIPQECKVLVIVKPTIAFSEEVKFKLDQYVMNGGKLLMFIDKLDAEMDSLQIKNELVAYDRGLKLDDLLFRYGVRINPDLIMDLQCDYLPFDVSGNGQFTFLPWNYFPVIESSNNNPINKNIGFISGRFMNSLDTTVEADGIKKTVILNSSSNARKIGTPARISSGENVTAPEDVKYKSSHIPAAVLLEGKFQSLFSNRLSQRWKDSLAKYNAIFSEQCIAENKMIVVADGDVVLNSVIKGNEPIPMGMNSFTYGTQREFPFSNRNFVENCLDYLIDEGGLNEAKAKEYKMRLLNVKKIEKEKLWWQLINLLLPMMAVVIFGFVFQYLRKHRFNKFIRA